MLARFFFFVNSGVIPSGTPKKRASFMKLVGKTGKISRMFSSKKGVSIS